VYGLSHCGPEEESDGNRDHPAWGDGRNLHSFLESVPNFKEIGFPSVLATASSRGNVNVFCFGAFGHSTIV